MNNGLPFAVWGVGLLAVVSLLLCIGWAMKGSRAWALFYGVLAAALAISSAVAAALYGGGFITP